jgi:BarA-like signal transduction histidine kinase
VSELTVVTPRVGIVVRRLLFWLGAALFALIITLVTFVTIGAANAGTRLDPTNPAPTGAMALAQVLQQRGVTVIATSSLEETESAIGDSSNTTLFIYDDSLYLTEVQLEQAVGLAQHVVLADATFGELRAVAPELAQAGFVDELLEADCDVPAVERADTVSGDGSGYRVVDDSADATSCLGSGDGVFSLIELQRDSGRLTILGATGALTNELIIHDGNAAFALGLLGETETLVWYVPTFADLESTGPETIGELTPAWVTPVLSLLVITFIVAAVWRGRRLGPLVIENLPVTVRSSETMLGRARLYERSSSRVRALDSLRIGSIQRLGAACGLPRVASVDEVIAAVASVTNAGPADIRKLLVDSEPQSDHDLIAYSDALLMLERDVARMTKP